MPISLLLFERVFFFFIFVLLSLLGKDKTPMSRASTVNMLLFLVLLPTFRLSVSLSRPQLEPYSTPFRVPSISRLSTSPDLDANKIVKRALSRRLHLFGGCTRPERVFLEHLLSTEVENILAAGAIAASRRSDPYSRAKFVEYFDGPYSDDAAESIQNWLMHVEIERGSTPSGRLGLYCRLAEGSRCAPHWVAYVYTNFDEIILVRTCPPLSFIAFKVTRLSVPLSILVG